LVVSTGRQACSSSKSTRASGSEALGGDDDDDDDDDELPPSARGDQRQRQLCFVPAITKAGSYTSPGPKQAVAAVALRLERKAGVPASRGNKAELSPTPELLDSALVAVAALAAGPFGSASTISRTWPAVGPPLKKTEAFTPRAT
jgi:hypothetical protein